MNLKYLATLVIVLATVLLAGCTTTVQMWEPRSKGAPSTVNITVGQSLQVYFHRLSSFSRTQADLDAWRQTGLFSSVTRAELDEPSATGLFVRIACKRIGHQDDSGAVTVIMWLLSAGIWPIQDFTDSDNCNMVMYENAVRIASTSVEIKHRTLGNGWGIIPSQLSENSRYDRFARDTAAIRVNSLLRATNQ